MTDVQTEAIVMAKHWLSYGQRGLVAALAILEDAAGSMLGQLYCAECDFTITGVPVKDAEDYAWWGAASQNYCSLACKEAVDERRINAAGNGAA